MGTVSEGNKPKRVSRRNLLCMTGFIALYAFLTACSQKPSGTPFTPSPWPTVSQGEPPLVLQTPSLTVIPSLTETPMPTPTETPTPKPTSTATPTPTVEAAPARCIDQAAIDKVQADYLEKYGFNTLDEAINAFVAASPEMVKYYEKYQIPLISYGGSTTKEGKMTNNVGGFYIHHAMLLGSFDGELPDGGTIRCVVTAIPYKENIKIVAKIFPLVEKVSNSIGTFESYVYDHKYHEISFNDLISTMTGKQITFGFITYVSSDALQEYISLHSMSFDTVEPYLWYAENVTTDELKARFDGKLNPDPDSFYAWYLSNQANHPGLNIGIIAAKVGMP